MLRFRTDHPAVRSPEMAQQLAAQFGKPVKAGWIRKRLLLAREKLAELLVEEVAQTLEKPTPEEIEQELIELELFEYCRPCLERRRGER